MTQSERVLLLWLARHYRSMLMNRLQPIHASDIISLNAAIDHVVEEDKERPRS